MGTYLSYSYGGRALRRKKETQKINLRLKFLKQTCWRNNHWLQFGV